MEIKFDKYEHTLVVSLKGDIDHHTAEIIKTAILKKTMSCPCRNIVFDLSGVSFMDSSGIGMIIGRYKEAEMLGGQVYAMGISPKLKSIFEISGLHKIIKVINGIEEIIPMGGGIK